MKIILLTALLVMQMMASNVDEFAKAMGYETNYAVAMKKAKAEGKNVMFFMVTQYCPWCKKYEKFTLKKASIDARIKEKYVPLIINREKKGFPEEYYMKITPAMHFIDAETEKKMLTSVGFKNKKEFMGILDSLEK
jgi:hypothetical protein